MTYTLFVGDYAYSSWSMRGWLLFDAFGIPFRHRLVRMYSAEFTEMQASHAPVRTVPNLRIGEASDGYPVWDSLAIAETLADLEPDAGLWPEPPAARAAARSLSAEIHAGFHALRGTCPMNLRKRYRGFTPPEDVVRDTERLFALWRWALDRFGGPFLAGERFTVVDAMYAPVATRLVTYGIALPDDAAAYVAAIYAHPAFRRWHAMADADPRRLDRYDMWQAEAPNEGPPRVAPAAAAVHEGDSGEAINPVCPFSGSPVKAGCLAQIDGRIVGFCNPFCRDKVVADAAAWPEVATLLALE